MPALFLTPHLVFVFVFHSLARVVVRIGRCFTWRHIGNGGERYPVGDRYPVDRYPVPGGIDQGGRYPHEEKYPGGGYIDHRYPADNRYPIDDRYPPDDLRPGSRYPAMRPGSRYPPTDDRYPDDDLMNDRGRYPARYPDRGYPERGYPMRPKYPYDDRDYYYPAPNRHPFEYPNEVYGGKDVRDRDRYKPIDRIPLPMDYDDRRYPQSPPQTSSHDRRLTGSSRYPNDDRYPYDRTTPVVGRLPPPEPVGGVGRPLVGDTRLPVTTGRYPIDDRYPVDKYAPVLPPRGGGEPYLPDSMYGRPESKYGDRYPPVSDNRFPVGNDRNPVFMYKYSNRVASQAGKNCFF